MMPAHAIFDDKANALPTSGSCLCLAGFAQGFGLAAVDMAGLLQDSFALADSGLLSIQTHLSLLR